MLFVTKSFSRENIYNEEKYKKKMFCQLASALYLERDFVANWIKRRNQFLTAVDPDLEVEVCLSGVKTAPDLILASAHRAFW